MIAATALVVLMALAGCGGRSPAAAPQAGSASSEPGLSALLRLARCARTHGMPGFPDPIVRDGVPQFPASAPRVTAEAQQACRSVAARIPAQYTSTQPVASSDLEQLRVLALCIRTHGVPDWPDPNALGEFPIDTRLQGGSGATKLAVMSAARSCAHVNPDPTASLNVVSARP